MANVNGFEDLEIWQLAREQCNSVFIQIKNFKRKNEFELISQIKRSSGSVMDNIAEGFERGGNNEFIHFLSISKGSNGELRSQFYRAFDQELIEKEGLQVFIDRNNLIGKKINSFIRYLNQSDIKGFKFHK